MNIKTYILTLTFLTTSISTFGQNRSVSWIQNIGGSSEEEAKCILPTSDGGLLVSGYSYSNDGLLINNKGFQDGWLVKTNSEGYIEWQKNIGGDGADVIEEAKEVEDGYIVCGWSASTTSTFVTSNGLEDGFVAKINKTGSVIWKKSLGGTLMDKFFDIEILDNGDVVAVGYLMSPEVTLSHSTHKGQLDLWVVRFNSDGQLVWQNAYGGSDDDFAYNITRTKDNKLIIAGSSDSMDGAVGTTQGEWDCWLVQLNLNGDLEWSNKFGYGNNEEIIDLLEYNNSYYIIGNSNSSGRTDSHGHYDAWIVQTDLNGNYINDFSFGSSENDLIYGAVATANGIFISGQSESSHSTDGWIMQIDGNGSVITSQLIGGSEYDILRDIAVREDAIFITGTSFSSDGDMTQNFGESDILVAKLDDSKREIPQQIQIFPNPAADNITLVLDKIGIEKITIYNAMGQIVRTIVANNFFQEQVNISDWTPGVYTVEISSNNELIQSQFIKL